MASRLKEYQTRRKKYFAAHPKQEIAAEYITSLTMMILSAFLFAISFRLFQSPNVNGALPLISGGASGLARAVVTIFKIGTGQEDVYLIYSIAYAIINLPILYLAFRYIGFRFGLFTTVNVIATSLITNFVSLDFLDTLAKSVACVVPVEGMNIQAGLLTRAILAGVLNGTSSAITLGFNGSAGGVDTISYYFSLRKTNTNIGRYTIIINTFVFILFATLNAFADVTVDHIDVGMAAANAFLVLLFVMIFSIMSAMVIDLINQRNKKDQIQIVTKQESLSKLLLANIPHGATIFRAKGAFTGEDRVIIYAIVSTYETKKVIELIREADPASFINVTSVKMVYGRFRTPKIK